ncbi:MAG: O-antigen ligase family protein [Alphaproteobacteria bacterium]
MLTLLKDLCYPVIRGHLDKKVLRAIKGFISINNVKTVVQSCRNNAMISRLSIYSFSLFFIVSLSCQALPMKHLAFVLSALPLLLLFIYSFHEYFSQFKNPFNFKIIAGVLCLFSFYASSGFWADNTTLYFVKIAMLLKGITIMGGMFLFITERKKLNIIIVILAGVFFINIILGVLQTIFPFNLTNAKIAFYNPNGLFYNPNTLTIFLVSCFILFYLGSKKWERPLMLSLFPIVFLIMATGSKIAFLGLLLFSLIVFLKSIAIAAMRRMGRGVLKPIFLLSAVCLLPFFFGQLNAHYGNPIHFRAYSVNASSNFSSNKPLTTKAVEVRRLLLEDAFKAWVSTPQSFLLGIGAGQGQLVGANKIEKKLHKKITMYPLHNIIAEILVEGGLFLFLGCFIFGGWLLVKYALLYPFLISLENEGVLYLSIFFASVFSLGLGGLAESSLMLKNTTYIFFGLFLCALNIAQKEQEAA